ncbi:MAG: hypothetical protein HN945_03150 [Deltaproteobacteria bacterium]|nr:hypothetical protein [Deltaproteobacteria bacterium]
MLKKLAQLSKEFNLKDFYSLVLQNSPEELPDKAQQLLVNIAPFLRKFASTYINYFELKTLPPQGRDQNFENRLEEFYADLAEQIRKHPVDDIILWLLQQNADENRPFFPSKPVVKNYSDISRGLNLLDELMNNIRPDGDDVFSQLLDHATAILSPEIDDTYEQQAKEILDGLQVFDARVENGASDSFVRLSNQITELNKQIDLKLMSNNSYVSIVQQITEINKALKTVFKASFKTIFSQAPQRLETFWSGLKMVGYAGGENCATGNYLDNLNQIHNWLEKEFPSEMQALLQLLDQSQKTPELPKLGREPIPEAIQIYALKLLGSMGLHSDKAIRLILSFYSRFVGKMVRDAALQTLRRNAGSVKRFFYQGLNDEPDYEQKFVIADKHDTIFDIISAESLSMAFGNRFQKVLKELDDILENEDFLLSNFIKSAYMMHAGVNSDIDPVIKLEEQLVHFGMVNNHLKQFKIFVENQSPGVFNQLLKMWGLNYIVSWSLADYIKEKRLFTFIVQAANSYDFPGRASKDQVIPLNNIITLLTAEPDAKNLIEKLMTILLNSKISFDFPLFRSLLQVVAQRNIQLKGNVTIRDGFSEQRGYASEAQTDKKNLNKIELLDPHIFQPIVIFLITVLKMKAINIPKDAFVETDISLYLNAICSTSVRPRLGYEVYLAHQLIASIPYIVDFASKHEGIIRKTIADLDESYNRTNTLIHYHRLKIHRAPSKLDLTYCLEVLQGLATQNLNNLLHRLISLMKGIGDEAIPDMEHYFEIYKEKLLKLGGHLRDLKDQFPTTPWQQIAETQHFEKCVIKLSGIDEESQRDILALVKLASALSNYWTQRITDDFIRAIFINEEKQNFEKAPLDEKLALIAEKRKQYTAILDRYDSQLEPYQHIFLKRHVIQCDWNFDFFGFWPFYSETKFESYNVDRKLSLLERHYLEIREDELSRIPTGTDLNDRSTLTRLRQKIEALVRFMKHLADEGLTPSRFFLDTIHVLEKDQLSISQLGDIIQILYYRELSHIESFIADTYGRFPEKITKALGRENLDFGLDLLSADDEELLYPLVQETVLGNIIAEAHPIFLLEKHLTNLNRDVMALREKAPAHKIFPDGSRPPRALSPVNFGYKAYALITLAQDGFAVPDLEVIPVGFFQDYPHLLTMENRSAVKSELIQRVLKLEEKTGKCFAFQPEKLTDKQWQLIESHRQGLSLNPKKAPRLLLSSRSGSYRSMPGILGTVVNIGYGDITTLQLPASEIKTILNTYRMFLSTFGNVVFGINEIEFSNIVADLKEEVQHKTPKKTRWEDFNNNMILRLINRFKELIEKRAVAVGPDGPPKPDWDDPLSLLTDSSIAVWNSWESEAARSLRSFLGISDDWKTAVTLMEMKLADQNSRSFSAILFSGDPQGKNNRPHGDILFGRPGEDIAAGLASEGTALESLEMGDPKLYEQIVDLLERVKINKGNVNVDIEMVGEYNPSLEQMNLFLVQERQMPLGKRAESEDYRLTPTDIEPEATGSGVNGGVQYGVFLDGVRHGYYELKDLARNVRDKLGGKDRYHGPAIFLLMKYVTPEEALKMNIPEIDGIITTKIGKSSHASISAKRDGKLFVCEADIHSGENGWEIGGKAVVTGDQENPDVFTVIANPKSVSPYSGNIYRGKMPLTKVQSRGKMRTR